MSADVCRWVLLFTIIFLICINKTNSKEVRVVCYYTNWSIYRPGSAKFSPQNINPYLCTHLVYAFGGFTKENTLKPFDKYQDIEKGGYAKFTGLKTYNKNLKTLLAIGGWNEGSSRFSPMVANAERRKELVKNTIKFLRQNHFDGLDLDWEYPSFRDGGKTHDRDNYAQLVQELREEFDRESEKTGRTRLLLTMAVPAGIEYINKGYDVPKLTKYLDWMNILSYDYHSAFEPAVNHHAPLYSLEEDSEYNYDGELNIDYTIKHYLKLGASPNKLVLGIPTYGRSYTLFNPDASEIGAPADGPGDMGEATRENGYLAYYEICENIKNQDWEVVQPNPNAMGPYAYKGNQWVGYDDDEIARKKAEYVAEHNLGGIMFWSIDNDDFRGNCHGKPYPIIEAAKEALISAYGLTDENSIKPTSKPTKTKTRTRPPSRKTTETVTEKAEVSVPPRRRNRIKPKTSSNSRGKSRTDRPTTTDGRVYSSLELVTPSYTTPAPPTTPDQGGSFKCEEEGFYPHPKDCKKYYWCLSGPGEFGIIAHQFTCPAGLYFNKAADSCDYTQNVLCNKKLTKPTTTTTTTTTTTEKPVKSRISIKPTTTTTTTTEAPFEDEYEYEDDVDDADVNDSEDPRVIKELLDLIKKAGGIEQLEKQLNIHEDGSVSVTNSDVTTPSSISKNLVQRVLNNAARNNINRNKINTKYNVINRNSRGPQNAGLETDTDEPEKKRNTNKLTYTTITRQRSSKSDDDKNEDDADEEVEEEDKKSETSKRNKYPEYVNIRRGRVTSTTEEPEDFKFSRNKILGEETDEDNEDDEEEEIVKTRRRPTTPQYVNIRRQRPSTTEGTTTSKYAIIRRSSTTESPEDLSDVNTTEPTQSRRRGTTLPPKEENSKYQTIRRGTTTTTTETIVKEASTEKQESTTQLPEIAIETETPTVASPESINIQTISNIGVTNIDDDTTQTTLLLSQPRPFSITSSPSPLSSTQIPLSLSSTTLSSSSSITPVIETTSRITKVSANSHKKTIRHKESSTLSTPTSRPRFRLTTPGTVATTSTIKTTQRPTIRARKRFSTTTESSSYDEYDIIRTYRPSEIADLSSLTAVDFGVVKDLNRPPNSRPRRIRPTTTTTTTEKVEESLKTSSRTLPLARKLIENSQFGKSRRVVGKTTEDQIKAASDVRIRGFTRSTTPSTESTTETVRSGVRTRKIIRRLRPTSTESAINQEDFPKSTSFLSNKRRLSRTSAIPSSTTEKITTPIVDNENDTETGNDVDSDEDITEEGENFKLSESNIRENNDINTSNIIGFNGDKPGKPSKGVKAKNEDDVKFRSTTEPSIVIRTRKIIRKLQPTVPTTTTTEATVTQGRRRKIIRRLRPTTENVESNSSTEAAIHIRGRPFRKQIDNEEKKFTQSKFNVLEKQKSSDELQKNKKSLLNRPKSRFQPVSSTTESVKHVPIDRSRYSTINRSTLSPQTTEAPKLHEDDDGGEEEESTEKVLVSNYTNNETEPTDRSPFNTVDRTTTLSPTTIKTVDEDNEETTEIKLDILKNATEATTEYPYNHTKLEASSTTELSRPNDDESSKDEATSEISTTEGNDENENLTEMLELENITETTTTTTTTAKPYINPILAKQKNRPAFRRPKLTTTHTPISTTVRNKFRFRTTASTTTTTTTTSTSTSTTTTPEPTTEPAQVEEDIKTEENLIITTTPESSTETYETTTEQRLDQSNTLTTLKPTTTTEGGVEVTTLDVALSTISEPETTLVDIVLKSTTPAPTTTEKVSTNVVSEPETTLADIILKSTTTEKIPTTQEITTDYPVVVNDNTTEVNLNSTPESQETTTTSTTTESVSEAAREVSTRKFPTTRPPRVFKPQSARKTSPKPSFKPSSTSKPLRNRFLYKYSTTERHHVDEDEEKPILKPTSKFTSPSVRNRFLYKSSTTEKYDEIEADEELRDEEYGDGNGEEIQEQVTPTQFLTKSTQKPSNKPIGFFRKTTETPKVTEDLSGIDTEAVKNRNKNLFNQKRKMNTPFAGIATSPATAAVPEITTTPEVSATTTPEVSATTTTPPIIELITTPITIETTTESLTTLHHVFAEPESTSESAASVTENVSKATAQSKIEKLIEVNRIIEVHGDKEMANSTDFEDKPKILDKIGAISRVTVIKVIDPDDNEIKPNNSNIDENRENNQSGEIAKVEEIPNPESNRSERKYESLSNKNLNTDDGNKDNKPLIIDGISNINVITPKPYFNVEASTISLEALFQTDNPHKQFTSIDQLTQKNGDEEILDTDHSQFIKVRVLNDNNDGKIDDYITMKAEVVEVTPTYRHETIKIVPIQLAMTKRLISSSSNTDFVTKLDEGVPKVDIKLIKPEQTN